MRKQNLIPFNGKGNVVLDVDLVRIVIEPSRRTDCRDHRWVLRLCCHFIPLKSLQLAFETRQKDLQPTARDIATPRKIQIFPIYVWRYLLFTSHPIPCNNYTNLIWPIQGLQIVYGTSTLSSLPTSLPLVRSINISTPCRLQRPLLHAGNHARKSVGQRETGRKCIVRRGVGTA